MAKTQYGYVLLTLDDHGETRAAEIYSSLKTAKAAAFKVVKDLFEDDGSSLLTGRRDQMAVSLSPLVWSKDGSTAWVTEAGRGFDYRIYKARRYVRL